MVASSKESGNKSLHRALSAVRETTDTDVEVFRSLVRTEMREIFENKVDEERKLKLIALHKLPSEDLMQLVRMEQEKGTVAGFHEVVSQILFLHQLTHLDKYDQLCDQIMEEFDERGNIPKF